LSKLASKTYQYEQFSAIRRYGWGWITFSPDGSQVAYPVDTSGQMNLWRQSSDGGFPHQLTTFENRAVSAVAWSPDGERIAFAADFEGDEFYQIFAIPAQGGVPVKLTNADKAWHEFSARSWSPSGKYLAYNANDRTPIYMDILVQETESGEVRRVLHGEEYYMFGNWAPDDQRILGIEMRSQTDSNLHLIDIHSGETKLLTPHEGEVKFQPGPWALDGSGFYMLTNQDREFTGLAYYDLDTETWDWVDSPDWDVQNVQGSYDGQYLAWIVNEGGYSALYVRDLRQDYMLSLPDLPKGVISTIEFSPAGNKLALMMASPTQCTEVFILDIVEVTSTQITHSMLGGIDQGDLIAPALISFKTFDERDIPAFLFKPKNADKSNPVPVVLSIHGGPQWQEFPNYAYSGVYQYWCSLGIAVLAPNIRGSTGYGKSYQKLIHRDWGGDDLKDVEAAAVYLRSLKWVDPDRLGIFGPSYGGFIVLSALSRIPDYWAAGVDIVGPSNIVTMLKTGPPQWKKSGERMIGDYEKDYDFLMSRSPVTYADMINKPLFIIQGANDQRVPKSESDQIVERIRENDVEVRYDVYEDMGHMFLKRESELKAFKDISDFFEHHLLT